MSWDCAEKGEEGMMYSQLERDKHDKHRSGGGGVCGVGRVGRGWRANIKSRVTFFCHRALRKTLDGQGSVEPSVQGFARVGICMTGGEMALTKSMANVQWLPVLPYALTAFPQTRAISDGGLMSA